MLLAKKGRARTRLIATSAVFLLGSVQCSALANDWVVKIEPSGVITFGDNTLKISRNTPFDTAYFQKKLLRYYYAISIAANDMLGDVITVSKDQEELLELTGDEGKIRFVSTTSNKVRGPTGQTIGDKLAEAVGSTAECEAGGDDWFVCWSKANPNVYYHPSCWEKIETGTNNIPPTCTITEMSVGLGD